jgi:D-serine deaminase-like pyridoxal phosphate-dependent protein
MMKEFNKPQLVVDKKKCVRNIQKMVAKAKRHDLSFRPHFKTHQSKEIADLYAQEGVRQITVSSVGMAVYFASFGWSDITIAFPVNIREIEAINDLNERIDLKLLVDSVESVELLNEQLAAPLGIFIKIDTGYGRAGIEASDESEIEKVAHAVSEASMLKLKGILTHAGHTYHAANADEIESIHRGTVKQMNAVKMLLQKYDDELIISVGDTPSCSLSENFAGVDEIRPGNYVFYDLQQYNVGSCSFDEVALILVCPVVGVYPKKEKIIIYGGGVHFSKQSMMVNGTKIHGQAVRLKENGWGEAIPETYLSGVSQEHGIVTCKNPDYMASLQPGDLIGVIPVHACLAVNLLRDLYFV